MRTRLHTPTPAQRLLPGVCPRHGGQAFAHSHPWLSHGQAGASLTLHCLGPHVLPVLGVVLQGVLAGKVTPPARQGKAAKGLCEVWLYLPPRVVSPPTAALRVDTAPSFLPYSLATALSSKNKQAGGLPSSGSRSSPYTPPHTRHRAQQGAPGTPQRPHAFQACTVSRKHLPGSPAA